MNPIPLAVVEKILKENGAERVSHKAKIKFAELLKSYADTKSKVSVGYATHSGRKTIKEKDIIMSFQELKGVEK